MKIYTRTGDAGQTALFGGDRVVKNHPRISAYGTVDEANAVLGLARTFVPESDDGRRLDAMLERVQNELFVVGSDLATPASARAEVPRIEAAHVEALERDIDMMERELEPLKTFILPGGGRLGATLHMARTVCRRAEREVVEAMSTQAFDARVAVYLNRLSDFLFVAARFATRASGYSDVPWKP